MDRSEAMRQLLPWHQHQWNLLLGARKNQRLGHALLLRGREGLGLRQFAGRLATALVCQDPRADTWPCGRCQSCELGAAGTHPDLMIIEPDEGKSTIGIVLVRRLVELLGLAPKLAGAKVAILSPAESLTREAANSLLKTLEEPPGDVVFLLIASSSTQLAPTVLSRCQLIDFPTPGRGQALQWLAEQMPKATDADLALDIAGGAPLRALAIMKKEHRLRRCQAFDTFVDLIGGQADPFTVAKHWHILGANAVVQWLASFVADCIRLGHAETSSRVVNRDHVAALKGVVRKVEPRHWYILWDCCMQANKDQSVSAALNDQLLLESVAMTCATLAQPRTS